MKEEEKKTKYCKNGKRQEIIRKTGKYTNVERKVKNSEILI